MAFIVETGIGLQDANSLTSVSFADEYFADRMNDVWSKLTVDAKQAALLRATAYVCGNYEFKGARLTHSQALCWPRGGIIGPEGQIPLGVPRCIQIATSELAVRASQGPLIQDPVVDEGGRPIKIKQLRAGPLQKMIEYAGPGEYEKMSRYPAVDALIHSWLLKTPLVFEHGVKVTPADVQGTSNSKMDGIASNRDRYIGPMNENQKDVGTTDDSVI